MVLVVKNPPANAGDLRGMGLIPGLGRFPQRRARQLTPVFLPGESHEQRILANYHPQGHKEKELVTTEETEHELAVLW